MHTAYVWLFSVVCCLILPVGCTPEESSENDSNGVPDTPGTASGEHDRDSGGESESEESGTEYGLGDVYDDVRHGARLILA